MKTLLLFTLCAGSLFSQTPRSYTTMPTPCGSQGEVALHIVGVKILPNTCQGDGTWKEQATIDQAVVLPLAQTDVTGLPAALTAAAAHAANTANPHGTTAAQVGVVAGTGAGQFAAGNDPRFPAPPATLTTALSPTSGSVVQGAAITSTATFTATSLAAGIVPSCTGMPTGVTSTYGTNPVAQTGGTSVITFAASASATLGAATISCIGTSGATVSAAATYALTVTAPVTGAASALVTSNTDTTSNRMTGPSNAFTQPGTGSFTTFAFIKANQFSSALQMPLAKFDITSSANQQYYMGYFSANSAFGCGTVDSGGAGHEIDGAIHPVINTWYFLTCVHDASAPAARVNRLYVNAVADGSIAAGASLNNTGAALLGIGGPNNTTGSPWAVQGSTAMAGKVSVALTPAQITYLYNGGLGLSAASLNAYLTAPAVDFLYEFTNGAALGADSSANATTLTAVGTISQGGGPNAPATLTTSLSPTSGSVAQSNTMAATMTFAASNLSSGIVPSCTGQPAGVTTTFGTNPVAQAGGTSVITFTASAVATVGGPTTISCIGTSGATVSAAATFAITVTAKGATTPTLTSGGVSVYTSPQTLTGATDWFEQSTNPAGGGNWSDRKLGGTIFNAGWTSTANTFSNTTGGTFNWTDGTTTATSSKTQSLEVPSSNNVSFTLKTDATARVLTVFSGAGADGSATLTLPMSIVAHSSNIALTDVTIPYSIGRGVLGAFVFNYQGSGSAGETLTITINSLDGNMYPLLAAGKVL